MANHIIIKTEHNTTIDNLLEYCKILNSNVFRGVYHVIKECDNVVLYLKDPNEAEFCQVILWINGDGDVEIRQNWGEFSIWVTQCICQLIERARNGNTFSEDGERFKFKHEDSSFFKFQVRRHPVLFLLYWWCCSPKSYMFPK